MTDTFDVEVYTNKLSRLRAEGKHDEAKQLKAAAFGIMYSKPGSFADFKRSFNTTKDSV
jgi:hypothetical protein